VRNAIHDHVSCMVCGVCVFVCHSFGIIVASVLTNAGGIAHCVSCCIQCSSTAYCRILSGMVVLILYGIVRYGTLCIVVVWCTGLLEYWLLYGMVCYCVVLMLWWCINCTPSVP
jgi:hypothetical protein